MKYVTRFTAFTFGISVGALIPLMFEPTPKPPTTPTLTQAQKERDAAIDFAIYYTLNIEARLQRLERLRPLLPEVRQ